MFFTISEGLIMSVLLVSVRYMWGRVYSNEGEVIMYVAKMVLLIAVSTFLDGIQCVLSGNYQMHICNPAMPIAIEFSPQLRSSLSYHIGIRDVSWINLSADVARDCGWQKICACINLGAFYIVGIQPAYLLAFVLSLGGMVPNPSSSS
jgi:MATE family multidrug resistance protein